MKAFLILIIALTVLALTACEQADFYKDGKPYRIEHTCLDKHKEVIDTLCHNKWGYHKCTIEIWVCTREKVDTIEIQAPDV